MPVNYEEFMQDREKHYERFFGPLQESGLHSTDAILPHIDIYQVPPRDDRPFWTLITGGMSDLRQPGIAEGLSPRAEILTYVREPRSWMISVLKQLAEMPFGHDTYLHWWHTVPNGMPMTGEPSALTNFFFLPPYYEDPEFDTLRIDGDDVDILWVIPITDAELNYKLDYGAHALEHLFEQKGLNQIIDECRKSLV